MARGVQGAIRERASPLPIVPRNCYESLRQIAPDNAESVKCFVTKNMLDQVGAVRADLYGQREPTLLPAAGAGAD